MSWWQTTRRPSGPPSSPDAPTAAGAACIALPVSQNDACGSPAADAALAAEVPLRAAGAAQDGNCSPMIERAYTVAAAWHRGQQRRSGDPFITHPVAVALILAELGMSPQVLCAALLHDVLECTPCTLAALRRDFGGEIADLVDKVTRLDKAHYESMTEAMTAAQSIGDSRVLMIKLADRLHNMRTLRYLTPAKQQQKSREALEGFARLARTLGMDAIERELVDDRTRTRGPCRRSAHRHAR
jgi:GTP pyrophosphokinase